MRYPTVKSIKTRFNLLYTRLSETLLPLSCLQFPPQAGQIEASVQRGGKQLNQGWNEKNAVFITSLWLLYLRFQVAAAAA
jgi:hypothetical protein